MTYIIPLTIIALSISVILYIISRKIHALTKKAGDLNLVYPDFEHKEETGVPTTKSGFLDGQLSFFSKIFSIGEGDTFFIFLEKFFRRMRVRLMRLENRLTSISNNLHEKGLRKRVTESGSTDANYNTQANVAGEMSDNQEERQKKVSFTDLNKKNEKFDEQYWLDVLKHDSGSAYPYKKLGEIYMARKDFREARSVFKYALKLDPMDGEAISKIEELRGKRTSK